MGSLDSLGPDQEEILPEMQPDIQSEIQPEILTSSSEDGLTVGSNQHVVPSPPYLDTDNAPLMCSAPFQDSGTSPPSSFCSPPQTELPTAESPAEQVVLLQDTFQCQDSHQQKDPRHLPFSQWHIHPPAPAKPQISVPVPQQQPNATAVSVAMYGGNSVAPQQTHSSESQWQTPPATSPSSTTSLLAPAAPPAKPEELLVERNLVTLDAPRKCDPVQSIQQNSTKVLKPFVQQIKKDN